MSSGAKAYIYFGKKDSYMAAYVEQSQKTTLQLFDDCPGAVVTWLKDRGELVPFLQRHLDEVC